MSLLSEKICLFFLLALRNGYCYRLDGRVATGICDFIRNGVDTTRPIAGTFGLYLEVEVIHNNDIVRCVAIAHQEDARIHPSYTDSTSSPSISVILTAPRAPSAASTRYFHSTRSFFLAGTSASAMLNTSML